MKSTWIGLLAVAGSLVTITSAAAKPAVTSVEQAARYQAEIVGKPPRIDRMPSEADRSKVDNSIPARDRELIILRVAWLCHSPHAWGQHVASAKAKVGLTSIEIERLTRGSSAQGWSPHDFALLKAVDELYATSMLSDSTFQALSREFSEFQIIELPLIMGHAIGGSYLINGLRIPLPEGSLGLSAR